MLPPSWSALAFEAIRFARLRGVSFRSCPASARLPPAPSHTCPPATCSHSPPSHSPPATLFPSAPCFLGFFSAPHSQLLASPALPDTPAPFGRLRPPPHPLATPTPPAATSWPFEFRPSPVAPRPSWPSPAFSLNFQGAKPPPLDFVLWPTLGCGAFPYRTLFDSWGPAACDVTRPVLVSSVSCRVFPCGRVGGCSCVLASLCACARRRARS